MARMQSSIELGAWLQTPPGLYLGAWEQGRLDQAVTDAFGFHALQLGLPEIDGLRANRMPHRWVACDAPHRPPAPLESLLPGDLRAREVASGTIHLQCEFDALPFPDASVDLVVLPHSLELTRDPHLTLREVERVLMPEGRVVIAGFNPASLWGIRQRTGRARQGVGLDSGGHLFLPRAGEFIGYWRLRDWLRLLGFEVEGGGFGCWRPPFNHQTWLDRFGWMDGVGERWWPVLGAVYVVVAVKRVRGMRLVGLIKQERRLARGVPAVLAQRGGAAIERVFSTNLREPAQSDAEF